MILPHEATGQLFWKMEVLLVNKQNDFHENINLSKTTNLNFDFWFFIIFE
jgi:hypothetical protein